MHKTAVKFLLLIALPAGLAACGKPNVGGEMTQHVKMEFPSVTLEDGVKQLYTNVYGRPPTDAELQDALTKIRAGILSLDTLRTQLAASAEAAAKVAQLVLQYVGQNPNFNNIVSNLLAQLGSGLSLADLQRQLSQM